MKGAPFSINRGERCVNGGVERGIINCNVLSVRSVYFLVESSSSSSSTNSSSSSSSSSSSISSSRRRRKRRRRSVVY